MLETAQKWIFYKNYSISDTIYNLCCSLFFQKNVCALNDKICLLTRIWNKRLNIDCETLVHMQIEFGIKCW